MKILAISIICILLAINVCADCDGRLEISDINNIDSNENIHIIVSTDQFMNTTLLRNVNVYLTDPGDNTVAQVNTRFSTVDRHTNLEIVIEHTENLLNGTYEARAEMNVVDSNNNNYLYCGKIAYSNHFRVYSSRVYYDNSPLYIGISQAYTTVPFSFNQRQCDAASGTCVNLNVAGSVPGNWTYVPILNWTMMNLSTSSDSHNLILSTDMWYSYANMKSCYDSMMNASNALAGISQDLVSCRSNNTNTFAAVSVRLDECRVQTNALTAEKAACQTDLSKANADFSAYKIAYNYTPTEAGMLGFGVGLFVLYAIMYTYNKAQSQKSPIEKSDI
jgi:hypothetical protein